MKQKPSKSNNTSY